MKQWELAAARHTLEVSQIYVTWRGKNDSECTRIGPDSTCFCGHSYDKHRIDMRRNNFPCIEGGCSCKRFEYIPTRPEECGVSI